MSGSDRAAPRPTVDVIIEMGSGIVLVRRKNPPPGWALPGGFVDGGESVATAARREAREETGLDVELVELLGVYPIPAGILAASTRSARRSSPAPTESPRAETTPRRRGFSRRRPCRPISPSTTP